MAEIGKVLIYGDIHLSSKSYGAHRDYPNESLEIFQKITNIAEKESVTHIIGTGDFTYGKFNSLEYRMAVQNELQKQWQITKGNRYELKGNHDSATNGMTEYEFYTSTGLIKTAENIDIANLHITMINNGLVHNSEINASTESGHMNIVIAHDYIKFKDTRLPNFGSAIEIDNMVRWKDVDYVICGHVHKQLAFVGHIVNDGVAKEVGVIYPGCMTRPSYSKDIDKSGSVIIITVHDTGEIKIDIHKVELRSIEDTFIIEEIEIKEERKEEKEKRVDISDIVTQLDSTDIGIGNPEDIIMSMEGIEDKYKLKAVQLLKEA